ncbi:MAG: transposase [Desulfopila sp.]
MLLKYSKGFDLRIWAYCLMDNHVHLLAVPEREDSLARGVGLTHQIYTQYLNHKLNQSGRIWQNRFFSCIVESDEYLWSVTRYIECNPIKAGLVAHAEDYDWSSAKAHLTSAPDDLLQEPSWLEEAAKASYAEFILKSDEETENKLRNATRTGRPFGSEKFIDDMEYRLKTNLRPRKPGRPKKTGECPQFYPNSTSVT